MLNRPIRLNVIVSSCFPIHALVVRQYYVPMVYSSHWEKRYQNGGMFRKRLWNWIWAYWVCSFFPIIPQCDRAAAEWLVVDEASHYYALGKRTGTRTVRFDSVTSYFLFQIFLLRYLWHSTCFVDWTFFVFFSRYVAFKLLRNVSYSIYLCP